MKQYRSLVFFLLILSLLSVTMITSCGGGGGDPNGEPCDECGQTDGFCQGEMGIPPFDVPEGDTVLPCDAMQPAALPQGVKCKLSLKCLQRAGSGQRRCFPFDADKLFRCLGDRAAPSGTPRPSTTPTVTSTAPTPTGPTPTPANGAAVCGNGLVDGEEDCDGENLDDTDCDELCDEDKEDLFPACDGNCRFDLTPCGICTPS